MKTLDQVSLPKVNMITEAPLRNHRGVVEASQRRRRGVAEASRRHRGGTTTDLSVQRILIQAQHNFIWV